MQRRVLVRARGLESFRHALVALVDSVGALAARRQVVIVPTRAAGELFRQTLEHATAAAGRASLIVPDLLTRDEWIARLHAALPDAPTLLGRVEREVLLARAAHDAAARHPSSGPRFELRPGLVAAMLDFYDELRRRQRTVRRAVRALFDELRVERGSDRGSEHLIAQTSFLGFAFLGYERALAGRGGWDEHTLRAFLTARQPALPFDHVVVAVADHPSDPRGLWPADFDLLGRLVRLSRVDVVVTDEAHDAGFRERLEQELPGIEETRAPDVGRAPDLVRPGGADATAPVFIRRDREEEVRAVARVVRARADESGGAIVASEAIVFQRPLPYLYLAHQVLGDARVPYQAFDALPLAAEPYAALLDLVLAVGRTGGTREAAVALLRSPLMRFEVDGRAVQAADAAALDAALVERRATGEADSYAAEVAACFAGGPRRRSAEARARRAAAAAAAIREALGPFRTGATASAQVASLAGFLRRHERAPRRDDSWRDRHLRARAAVLAVLDELDDAFRRHDPTPRDPDALTAAIHHAIETRTFTPRRGDAGVHLVDAVAARFGEFDHVYVVGLVETDWPQRMKRSIFYSAGLLKELGWPQESDQSRAEQAAFRDLLGLARGTTRLSAFQFEGDAVVALSPLVEAVRGGPTVEAADPSGRAIFADEVLTGDLPPVGLDDERAAWFALRHARPSLADRAYSGFVDPQPVRTYRVSRVDRYVDCPFKYFSESVLKLPEERDESAGLTPLERGTLLHGLFERFYLEWQADGRRAITPANLPEALTRFSAIVRDALERLPDADRALEETRLLGSLVGTGVAERVFELEADSGAAVRERLVEFSIKGAFTFPVLHGLAARQIDVHGRADRIDVLEDGSLRVVDYKLGQLPDTKTSVQIAVYAHCARQALEKADGSPHPVSAATYLAFGDDRKLEGALGGPSEPAGEVVEARAAQFASTVGRIESGAFPPQPKRPGACQWCLYAGVCRKEYVVQDDDAAEPV